MGFSPLMRSDNEPGPIRPAPDFEQSPTMADQPVSVVHCINNAVQIPLAVPYQNARRLDGDVITVRALMGAHSAAALNRTDAELLACRAPTEIERVKGGDASALYGGLFGKASPVWSLLVHVVTSSTCPHSWHWSAHSYQRSSPPSGEVTPVGNMPCSRVI